MQFHRLAMMAGVAVLALSACTSGPEFEPDPAPPKPVAFEEGASGLRGIPADSSNCRPGPEGAYVEATVMVSDPTELIVCAHVHVPVGEPPATIALQPGTPPFERLVVALSQPDDPYDDYACPANLEAPEVLYAQTAAGLFRLAIPVERCGYQAQAKRAIRVVARGIR